MIDLIGDIHGYATKLEELLQKLRYKKRNLTYTHPERKVIFVGDYIDRGPQIRETLEIVKRMVDDGSAIALMGNHEYNALCFHYKANEGGHLRPHLIKNVVQHYETLKQFQNNQKEYDKYIDWFKTLPLFLEKDGFRAVHACWDNNHIDFLKTKLSDNILSDAMIYESVKEGTAFNIAVEETLKGKEVKMPDNLFFHDKDGTKRTEIRIKWWEDPASLTYRSLSVIDIPSLPDLPVDTNETSIKSYYGLDEKHVFFGHYWLKGLPVLYRNNVCCLDFSVAKGGHLVAYSYDDETSLDSGKLTFV